MGNGRLCCFNKMKRLKLEDLHFGLGLNLCSESCQLYLVGGKLPKFSVKQFLDCWYFVRIIYLNNGNGICFALLQKTKQNKKLFFCFTKQADKRKMSCSLDTKSTKKNIGSSILNDYNLFSLQCVNSKFASASGKTKVKCKMKESRNCKDQIVP